MQTKFNDVTIYSVISICLFVCFSLRFNTYRLYVYGVWCMAPISWAFEPALYFVCTTVILDVLLWWLLCPTMLHILLCPFYFLSHSLLVSFALSHLKVFFIVLLLATGFARILNFSTWTDKHCTLFHSSNSNANHTYGKWYECIVYVLPFFFCPVPSHEIHCGMR